MSKWYEQKVLKCFGCGYSRKVECSGELLDPDFPCPIPNCPSNKPKFSMANALLKLVGSTESFRKGEYDYIRDEVTRIVSDCGKGGVGGKVIGLTEDDIKEIQSAFRNSMCCSASSSVRQSILAKLAKKEA